MDCGMAAGTRPARRSGARTKASGGTNRWGWFLLLLIVVMVLVLLMA